MVSGPFRLRNYSCETQPQEPSGKVAAVVPAVEHGVSPGATGTISLRFRLLLL